MNHLLRSILLLSAVIPSALFGAEERAVTPPTAPTEPESSAQPRKEVEPAAPGLFMTAENLKTYLIPCHRNVATTIYIEDKVVDTASPFFLLEGTEVDANDDIHKWIYSFNAEESINYITLFPNPYLEKIERRNLNIICAGKVFSIEPYNVTDESRAARMVYFSAKPASGAGLETVPRHIAKSPAIASSPTAFATSSPPVTELPPDTVARITGVSPVPPPVKNHGVEPNVLISYLQKFKILAGLPGSEMPDVNVLHKHFPAADFRGLKTGILDVFRVQGRETLGVHCYIKNDSAEAYDFSGKSLRLRIGEKIFLSSLCDPETFQVQPGGEKHFFGVFMGREFDNLDLAGNHYELIGAISSNPSATKEPAPFVEQVVEMSISTPVDWIQAKQIKVMRQPESHTVACLFTVTNNGDNAVNLADKQLVLTCNNRTIASFKMDSLNSLEVAPGKTVGFAAYFLDQSLSSEDWRSLKITAKLQEASK